MRRVRRLGLYSIAVLAVSVLAAVPASAEPPEFRVENKKTKELEPLKKKVAFTQVGTGTTLRSASGVELVCASSSGKGKLTGPKTLTLKMTYAGCETAEGTSCQTGRKLPGKSKPGVITIKDINGRLVDAMEGPLLVPAIELAPPSGTPMLEYVCGGKQVVVSGQVLGAIGPLEEPTSELTETFAEGAEPEPGCGRQEIQLVEGMGPCQHLILSGGMGTPTSPTWMIAVQKKEFHKGHVALLK